MLLCDSHTMEEGVPLIKPLSKLKEFILFYSDQPIAYFALVVCKPNNVDKYDTKGYQGNFNSILALSSFVCPGPGNIKCLDAFAKIVLLLLHCSAYNFDNGREYTH